MSVLFFFVVYFICVLVSMLATASYAINKKKRVIHTSIVCGIFAILLILIEYGFVAAFSGGVILVATLLCLHAIVKNKMANKKHKGGYGMNKKLERLGRNFNFKYAIASAVIVLAGGIYIGYNNPQPISTSQYISTVIAVAFSFLAGGSLLSKDQNN